MKVKSKMWGKYGNHGDYNFHLSSIIFRFTWTKYGESLRYIGKCFSYKEALFKLVFSGFLKKKFCDTENLDILKFYYFGNFQKESSQIQMHHI